MSEERHSEGVGWFAMLLLLLIYSRGCDIEDKVNEINKQLEQIQERQIVEPKP